MNYPEILALGIDSDPRLLPTADGGCFVIPAGGTGSDARSVQSDEWYYVTAGAGAPGRKGSPSTPYVSIAAALADVPATVGSKDAKIMLMGDDTAYYVDLGDLNNVTIQFGSAKAPPTGWMFGSGLYDSLPTIKVCRGAIVADTKSILRGCSGINIDFFSYDYPTYYGDIGGAMIDMALSDFGAVFASPECSANGWFMLAIERATGLMVNSHGMPSSLGGHMRLRLQNVGSLTETVRGGFAAYSYVSAGSSAGMHSFSEVIVTAISCVLAQTDIWSGPMVTMNLCGCIVGDITAFTYGNGNVYLSPLYL